MEKQPRPPRPARTPRWLTTPQMALRLDMHSTTLLKFAKSRRVPPAFICQMGTRYRWRADFAERPVFLEVPLPHPEGGLSSGTGPDRDEHDIQVAGKRPSAGSLAHRPSPDA